MDPSASAAQAQAGVTEVQRTWREALTAVALLGAIFALDGHPLPWPAESSLKLADIWPGDEDEQSGQEA